MINTFSVVKKLDKWVSLGLLSHLDRAFVRFLQDQEPNANPLALWAGALVSQQLGQGKVYLDIEKLCLHPRITLATDSDDAWMPDAAETLSELTWIKTCNLEHWKKELNKSSLVSLSHGNTPLVLTGSRLYLRRYWQYQQILNTFIEKGLHPVRDSLPEDLQKHIALLFSSKSHEKTDWQKIACVLALRANFTIITGGPGTGKTTTLTKLLTLLSFLANNEPNHPTHKFRILLAAPTGKAAARVSEAIVNALKQLDISNELKQAIPKKASTLHRLLGSRHDSRLFAHNRNNPLVADVVIVDEASMIDLEIMAALMDALPETAQLILLGDKDQLASVEAGSVLGDLCLGAEHAAYDQKTREWIRLYANEDLVETTFVGSAINQQTVMFRYSHRFNEGSGIGQLAMAVNNGDIDSAQTILNNTDKYKGINRLRLSNPADEHLKRLVMAGGNHSLNTNNSIPQGYGFYLDMIHQQRPRENAQYDQWAKQVLEAFDAFRLLTVLRLGAWGCDNLNQQIEAWLFPKQKPALWYEGRPVMITRNDYNLGLMNGAIGIALYNNSGKLLVAFPRNDDNEGIKIFWVSPMRLTEVETAFAMTVHKSQGSEFNHAALILPESINPILTRELIYTGITRAKENFTLLESSTEIFNEAILTSCK